MNDYIHLLKTKTHQVDGSLLFSKSKILQSCTLGAPIVVSCSHKKYIFSIYLVFKWLGNQISHHSNLCFVKKTQSTYQQHNSYMRNFWQIINFQLIFFGGVGWWLFRSYHIFQPLMASVIHFFISLWTLGVDWNLRRIQHVHLSPNRKLQTWR